MSDQPKDLLAAAAEQLEAIAAALPEDQAIARLIFRTRRAEQAVENILAAVPHDKQKCPPFVRSGGLTVSGNHA